MEKKFPKLTRGSGECTGLGRERGLGCDLSERLNGIGGKLDQGNQRVALGQIKA